MTLAPDAPVIHEEALKGDNPVNIRGHVFDTVDITIGDVGKAFDEANLVLTKHFRTSKSNPVPLERTAVICVPEGNGHVDVWGASQGIHLLQKAFVAYGAIQCGYCTPGMLLSSKTLLDRNPHPTMDEQRRPSQGTSAAARGMIKYSKL
ncbi:2Fe-2S iron-sulfur cluster-binding protein [Cloacibacillus sp.]